MSSKAVLNIAHQPSLPAARMRLYQLAKLAKIDTSRSDNGLADRIDRIHGLLLDALKEYSSAYAASVPIFNDYPSHNRDHFSTVVDSKIEAEIIDKIGENLKKKDYKALLLAYKKFLEL